MKIADPENANEINRIMLRKGSLLVNCIWSLCLQFKRSNLRHSVRRERRETILKCVIVNFIL